MDSHIKKADSTKKRTATYLEKWILPRWGEYRPGMAIDALVLPSSVDKLTCIYVINKMYI